MLTLSLPYFVAQKKPKIIIIVVDYSKINVLVILKIYIYTHLELECGVFKFKTSTLKLLLGQISNFKKQKSTLFSDVNCAHNRLGLYMLRTVFGLAHQDFVLYSCQPKIYRPVHGPKPARAHVCTMFVLEPCLAQ